jgi:hypothetical protein
MFRHGSPGRGATGALTRRTGRRCTRQSVRVQPPGAGRPCGARRRRRGARRPRCGLACAPWPTRFPGCGSRRKPGATGARSTLHRCAALTWARATIHRHSSPAGGTSRGDPRPRTTVGLRRGPCGVRRSGRSLQGWPTGEGAPVGSRSSAARTGARAVRGRCRCGVRGHPHRGGTPGAAAVTSPLDRGAGARAEPWPRTPSTRLGTGGSGP